MRKLVRVTTSDISLSTLLRGQLGFLNQYFEVVAVSADTGLSDGVRKREGIRVINIPIEREISLAKDLRSLYLLYRLLRKEKPSILHANTPKGSLLAMTAGWAARIPHRIYLVTGLRFQGEQGVLKLILKTMERITCHFATLVIPEGTGVKKALQSEHITKKPLRVLHYGNITGKDTSYFSIENTEQQYGSREAFRQELGFKADDFVFIFIGRIVKDKGINELASSLRRLRPEYPHLKLLLVGWWESEADSISSDNDTFLRQDEGTRYVGYQDDIRPYLMAADALVFPSYREGFPNVILEAGSMGLPSIVTDINGCNEVIKNGVNGHIIPPRDETALYEAMRQWINDPSAIRKMSESSRRVIQERYEQKDVWDALLKMYQSLEI